jgi:hypothetical protein
MPTRTCNPADWGATWAVGRLGIGPILLEWEAGWDGVSVWPECNGPLHSLHVLNTSTTDTWYAHFKGKRGQPKVIDIPPSTDRTFNQGQLGSRGFQDASDLGDLQILPTSTPPA